MNIADWFAEMWARWFPAKDWVLTGSFGGKSVVVSMNKRFGAAIYSLKWGGIELLDSSDHGRELQTAWQLDGQGEGQNPTEAGGSYDNYACSTSVIFAGTPSPATFSSSVHPAYWNVYNGQKTSPDTLTKTVVLGYNGLANVIRHNITIILADNHTQMSVEGITGYMSRTMNKFYTLQGEPMPLPTPPLTGWQMMGSDVPVIVANADGSRAIGCYAPTAGYAWGTIGGWPKFDSACFTKAPALAGSYSYVTYTVFGTLQDVVDSLKRL